MVNQQQDVEPEESGPSRKEGPWEPLFVENMRRLREKEDMTQTDLAKALKARGLPFHQPTIQRIENGDRPVRLNEAFAIAEELGSDLETMLRPSSAVLQIRSLKHAIKDFEHSILQLHTAAREYNALRNALMREMLDAVHHSSADEVRALIATEGAAALLNDNPNAVAFLLRRIRLPASAIASEAETRYYLLDDAPDGNTSATLEHAPIGELTLEQQTELARWELEAATSAAEQAEDRLENAKQNLASLEQGDENAKAGVPLTTLYVLTEALAAPSSRRTKESDGDN